MARSSFFRFENEGTGIRDDLPPGHAPSVTVFAPLPEEWFEIDFNDSGRWGWSNVLVEEAKVFFAGSSQF